MINFNSTGSVRGTKNMSEAETLTFSTFSLTYTFTL